MAKPKINLFGTHAVRAAWQNPDRHIQQLLTTQQALKEFEPYLPVKGAKRPPPRIVDRKELDKATNGATHQGIGLMADPLEEVFLGDLTARGSMKEKSTLIMLDQVTDPHNVGAILRSACAFGADGLILQRKHAPDLEGILAKTACGALEHCPVAHETNLSRAIETLKDAGYTVIGLDERGQQVISDFSSHEKTVLVLGAEGPGLRRNVAEHCDVLAKLEMHGPMPSINVSNAAAVAMYALT